MPTTESTATTLEQIAAYPTVTIPPDANRAEQWLCYKHATQDARDATNDPHEIVFHPYTRHYHIVPTPISGALPVELHDLIVYSDNPIR